ncbi:RNA polymerase factor sigma-54 [Clostridiisalibacter paucivorans]|uniref:RNA polymerase factor sigma-54 n=1 Tax=Clostridiisalibacter paucivorans TaxID=408753 RepID=UPI000478B312|nr:RNA polymerase factor sigma-54 [Clostridiisalibacter paucivorans]
MRLGFDLSLEQAQKLIMTPELRQAIKLLQFNSQELWEYIDKQTEANPLLEVMDRKNDHESVDEYNDKLEKIDWKEYFKHDEYSSGYRGAVNYKEKEYSFENFISTQESLRDHLLLQLDLTIFDKSQKQIGEMIIQSVDKNGYLDNSVQDIATQLNINLEEVEEVLKTIQTFDPLGVASRDIRECLTIQLESKEIKDENVYKVVDSYLEDIARNKLCKISKELNISVKRVQWICDLIKSLEPKPGRGFPDEGDDIKFVTPDVVLQKVDGEYIIIINDITAPRLTISNFYKDMLNNSEDNNTSKFINGKLNSAMWLIKSIEQRRMTIYKVVKSILKFQGEFFKDGKKALKPLTLKDVAEDIGVHESTVSRATNGKYIQTPVGIYELKFFFSSGVSSQGGGIASTSIKDMIKDLIDNEDSKKPLSDQNIANLLKKKNIKISRRTVAKYRDELNIPSSTGRRRFS